MIATILKELQETKKEALENKQEVSSPRQFSTELERKLNDHVDRMSEDMR
jgi:hypothetical protein